MKKNNLENYQSEGNIEEAGGGNINKAEFFLENSLEELRQDFDSIEKEYEEIINNSEASLAEKKEASIWSGRAKSLLYKGLVLLSLSLPAQIKADTKTALDINIDKSETPLPLSGQDKWQVGLEKYKDLGPLMALNLASENPSNYQLAQI